MTRPFFTKERISHFDIFSRHADTALSLASRRLRGGYAVDVQDLFGRFTLDSATDFLTGRCLNSLEEELPYPRGSDPEKAQRSSYGMGVAGRFSKSFLEAQFYMEKRTRRGEIWPLWEMKRDATKEPMMIVEKFLTPILSDALSRKDVSGGGDSPIGQQDELEEEETLVDHLVKQTNGKITSLLPPIILC